VHREYIFKYSILITSEHTQSYYYVLIMSNLQKIVLYNKCSILYTNLALVSEIMKVYWKIMQLIILTF